MKLFVARRIERASFAATKTRRFDASNLLRSSDLDLQAVMASSKAAEAWNNDHSVITRKYPAVAAGGGVNPGDRRAIHALVLSLRPETLLEVGTHVGSSTLYIAHALKRVSTKARMATVDIHDVNAANGAWAGVGLEMSPRDYADKLSCADVIDFRIAPAMQVLESNIGTYDFIFLDGDHSAAAVYQEVSAALVALRPGGVILLHDYYPGGKPLFSNGTVIEGPYLAMKRVVSEQPQVKVIPLGDLPWPTKLGTNVTSLALLVRAN